MNTQIAISEPTIEQIRVRVLPDGRIASLWLNAPDNPAGFHELKVMDASGSNSFRAVVGVDVADAGIGCGGATDAIFASGFETGVAQRE